MQTFDLLQKAIAKNLARVIWQPTEHDEAWDIDLSKGVDDEGYTIDGGMAAKGVRCLQNGELESMDCIIEIREPSCSHCNLTPGWEVVASLCCIWVGSRRDCKDTEEELAEEAADALRAALARS